MRRALVATCLLALLLPLAAACTSVTRGAIRNDTGATLTVVLRTADSAEQVRFEAVAPGTTTAFQKLPFKDRLAQVVVEITGGEAMGGAVDLKKTYDNVVVVSGSAPPSLDAQENPDNTFW